MEAVEWVDDVDVLRFLFGIPAPAEGVCEEYDGGFSESRSEGLFGLCRRM